GSMEFKTNEAWTKRLQVGNANRNGVLAVELASQGFTGPLTVFEGKHGFFHSYCGEGFYDLTDWLSDLGSDWEINYIQFKPFGCAGVLHSAVTAAKKLVDENQISPEKIKELTVYTSSKILEEYASPVEKKIKPGNMVGAQFSLQYCVAAMIVKGQLLVEEFWENSLSDPVILDLAARIKVEADPQIDLNWPVDDVTIIKCRTKDGSRYSARTGYARGDLLDPVLENELIDKFLTLTGLVFPRKQCEEIMELCLKIEEVPDINLLIEKCLQNENDCTS
ncbi:MAG TPA: MmgE/PrpD family protein, partial [Clostridia bacterium]|nr:MmgE/PrpD family protein [Clostridia bacterium]